jgi:hypothetical protein
MRFSVRLSYVIFGLCLLLLHSGQAQERPACAATLSELRLLLGDPDFPLLWKETTMDDDKPLLVTILEREGSLRLEFFKTREGLWAQSFGVICGTGRDIEIRFGPEQIRLGPAANWVLRLALANGGKFTLTRLGSDRLRIAGGGWSGTFSPIAKSTPHS